LKTKGPTTRHFSRLLRRGGAKRGAAKENELSGIVKRAISDRNPIIVSHAKSVDPDWDWQFKLKRDASIIECHLNYE
jgi:hypothetical protein